MEDNANHTAAAPRTVCQICGREFCDPQASTDDLIECYRLGYERLRAVLRAAGQGPAPAAPKEPQP